MLEYLNSKEPSLIQNALRIKSTGQILISRHRHDYQTNDDKTIVVDGGLDYAKRMGTFNNKDIE